MKSFVCQCSALHVAYIVFGGCISGIVSMHFVSILEGVAKIHQVIDLCARGG